jgi:hypothetical protein
VGIIRYDALEKAGFDPTDNATPADNQADRCLLLVCGVGNSAGDLVEGTAACTIGKRYLIDRGDLDAFIGARIRERC